MIDLSACMRVLALIILPWSIEGNFNDSGKGREKIPGLFSSFVEPFSSAGSAFSTFSILGIVVIMKYCCFRVGVLTFWVNTGIGINFKQLSSSIFRGVCTSVGVSRTSCCCYCFV